VGLGKKKVYRKEKARRNKNIRINKKNKRTKKVFS
jgi:hypothetical protein